MRSKRRSGGPEGVASDCLPNGQRKRAASSDHPSRSGTTLTVPRGQRSSASGLDLPSASDIIKTLRGHSALPSEGEAGSRLPRGQMSPATPSDPHPELEAAWRLPQDHLSSASGSGVAVSLFITKSQRSELLHRGYSEEAIRVMKPEEAHRVLGVAFDPNPEPEAESRLSPPDQRNHASGSGPQSEGAAVIDVLRGQISPAAPSEPHSRPGAKDKLPRGYLAGASGLELPSEGAAAIIVPRGQFVVASPSDPHLEPEAVILMPSDQVGHANGSGTSSEGAAEEGVPRDHVRHATPSDPIASIVSLQRERVFYIRAQQRLDRMTESFIAQRLGHQARNDGKWDEKDKTAAKAIFAEAKRVRVGVERGEIEIKLPRGRTGDVADDCATLILTGRVAREAFDQQRADVEARMVAVAKDLPVYPWVQGVRGVTAKGLAIVVGEAGDLSSYPKKGHLWKRLGLAVYDGRRQGSVPKEIIGEARKEAWKARGYKPARRAELYAMFDDTMFRSQWRGEKDGVSARALGPYGEYYGKKKAEYVAREKPYADRSARRAMTKMFIRDLWKAWRAAVSAVLEDREPPAALHAAE